MKAKGESVSSRRKMRVPLSPYRHFERSEKSPLHNGQATSVRCGAAEAPRRFYHYLISTECRYDVKDPAAPLGMTIRETAFLIFPFIPRRFQPPPRRGTSFHGKEGECRFPMKKTYDTRIPLSSISSFRAKREIFLAHRSSDEREMRSST